LRGENEWGVSLELINTLMRGRYHNGRYLDDLPLFLRKKKKAGSRGGEASESDQFGGDCV